MKTFKILLITLAMMANPTAQATSRATQTQKPDASLGSKSNSKALKRDHENDIALLVATASANQLARAITLKDLANVLNTREADRKAFLNDIKKLKLENALVPIFQYSGTHITFGRGSTELKVDFKHAAQKILYLNGRKIEVATRLSYADAVATIKNVIGNPSKKQKTKSATLSLSMNSAVASTQTRADNTALQYIYGLFFSGAAANVVLLEMPISSIAGALSLTYKAQISRDVEFNFEQYENHPRSHYHAISLLRFTCKGGRLDTITPGAGVKDGEINTKGYSFISNKLKYNPADNTFVIDDWFGRHRTFVYGSDGESIGSRDVTGRCKIRTRYDGTIVESKLIGQETESHQGRYQSVKKTSVCPPVGSSLFDIGSRTQRVDQSGNIMGRDLVQWTFDNVSSASEHLGARGTSNDQIQLDYGQFPVVADACCQEKGCAEKVNSGVDRALQAYVDRVKAAKGLSSSNAESESATTED